MNIFHGPGWEIAIADVTVALRELPASSVHTAITSVPYWGLRDYGVEGQIGLEPHPDLWVKRLVAVCEEIKRVLRDDGTFWLNVGDSYAQGGRGPAGVITLEGGRHNLQEGRAAIKALGEGGRRAPAGLKEKDLIGQPWMLAFALRAAGWYLRADVIWSKPNPMPESIKDRPTKSHEYVFLLTKKPTYFYDADAIREDRSAATIERDKYGRTNTGERIASHKPGASPANGSAGITSNYKASGAQGRNVRSVWSISTARFDEGHFATFPPELPERCIKAGTSEKGVCPICGAPWVRVVARGPVDPAWQAACGGDASGEYAGVSKKHQAEMVTAVFGAGRDGADSYRVPPPQNASELKVRILAGLRERRTVGWKPTCGCSPAFHHSNYPFATMVLGSSDRACADPSCRHALRSHGRDHTQCGHCRCHVFRWGDPYDPVPATVLDPFSGAATTGLVALRLGRRYLGVELSPKYAEISKRRLEADIDARAAALAAKEFGITAPTATEQKAMASQMKLFGGE